MLTFFLIFTGLAGIFCIYLAMACLFAAARENSLPDIEDVETRESCSG